MDKIQERLDRYKQVPVDLYVTLEDVRAMRWGGEGLGYIQIPDESEDYELISRFALQPAFQLDDNTFSITFIMK